MAHQQDTDTPSLKEFCDELGTIHYKWFKFGISLDVPYDVLKGFEGEKDPLAAVITYWRAGNTVVSVSWKSIADALKSNQEGGLARKIEIKYCSGKSNIHGVQSKQEYKAPIPSVKAIPSIISEEMTAVQLQSALLSSQMPKKDCKIFEENDYGGIAFMQGSEDELKDLKISAPGLSVWKKLKETSSNPAGVGQAMNGASGNVGGNDSGSSQEKETKYPGRTVVKEDHYGSLCMKLRPCAAKWEDIAKGLGFKGDEIANIKAEPMRLAGAPGSFMDGVLERWSHWAPNDARGSKDYATLEALKMAVDIAGYHNKVETLALK